MKEWHRTVILMILLIVAVGFLVWVRQNTEGNFLDSI